MRALAESGRRTDALRAFQAYRAFLLDEVGTEPSQAIANLDREIAQGRGPDVTLPSGRGHVPVHRHRGIDTAVGRRPGRHVRSLRHHDAIVRETIESCGGYVFSTAGDSFAAAFERVDDAVGAATATQRALDGVDWGTGPHLRVRMGFHAGVVDERGGSYYGPVVNIAALASPTRARGAGPRDRGRAEGDGRRGDRLGRTPASRRRDAPPPAPGRDRRLSAAAHHVGSGRGRSRRRARHSSGARRRSPRSASSSPRTGS